MYKRHLTKQTWLIIKWILENDYPSIHCFMNKLTLTDRYTTVSMPQLNGLSLLHYAASHGRWEIVKYFVIECLKNVDSIYRGAGLNTIPLFIAIWRGDYQLVRLLTKLGANLSWQNLFAENAIVYACKHQQLRLALYLKKLECCLDTDRNVQLCAKSPRYCLSSLLAGTSVNATDSKGDSIFILAAKVGQLNVLTILLHFGVDVRYKNRSLDNAISAALWKLQLLSYGFLLKTRVYTRLERALAFELCGAKMILFQSRYQEALDLWAFSIKLRLRDANGIAAKLDYYYKKRIQPIKEFQSALDISQMRENTETCIEQAHLVYTRIRDISVWKRPNLC